MENKNKPPIRNIFIIGAKSIGQYGGFESFVDHLTEQHQGMPGLEYTILIKANGEGSMDETLLPGVKPLDENSFLFRGARIVKIRTPNIGHAQALAYDIRAWRACLRSVREGRVERPFFYVLGCRRWLSFRALVKKAHKLGGTVCINPDGHEWKRSKWSPLVRLYLKQCEKAMIRSADLIVCDSMVIRDYVLEAYAGCHPQTRYIAYGAEPAPSELRDDDPKFLSWLTENSLAPQEYLLCCGRFVPENNFETIIREFRKSSSRRSLVIITTENRRFFKKLDRKLHFEGDPRIRFAHPVYDRELLKKIRENAFAGIHGHMVGGTNPNLLESLAGTSVNLVLDVRFNREVAGDAALYWSMEDGCLARLIDEAEAMCPEQRSMLSQKAKDRIRSVYTWEKVSAQYKELFCKDE